MESYVSIPDSDSDGERSKETCQMISSDSEEGSSPCKGRPLRSRGTKKSWSSFLPQRLRPSRKKNSRYSPIINLDSTSESSNDSVQSASVAALKETQLTTTTTATTRTAVKNKVVLDQAPAVNVTNSLVDTENVHPADTGHKHKSTAGSDSDSEDGAPVVKKATKSKTFRRGLSSRKPTPSQTTPQITEDSCIYSTRVSNCMNALRKGMLDIPVDLADSASDNEENGFMNEKKGRLCSSSLTNDVIDVTKLDDSLQNSPSWDDSLTFANRSPSPPPASPTALPKRAMAKMSKKVQTAINFLNAPLTSDYTPVPEQDLMFDGEEVPDKNREMTVKVRSRSGIQRFSLKMTDTFKSIFSEMAKHEGVKESQIMMFRRDESLRPTNTPESLNLHVADIIDCHLGDEKDLNESLDGSFTENVITIFIQGKNSRSKTAIKVRKDEPLQTGLEQYCKRTGVAIETVTLQFDGDVVNSDQTPDDLDMEEGDCVDAITTG